MFDNKQDANSVANSFHEIVMLLNVFEVSGYEGCVRYLLTDVY